MLLRVLGMRTRCLGELYREASFENVGELRAILQPIESPRSEEHKTGI